MSWRETSLGEVLSVRHGKSQRAVESPSGRYPVLATGGRIGWSRIPLYSKPSVLIGRKGTIDRPQYQESPFWSVDTLFYTELTKSVDPRFIYYIFQTIDWRSMNEASGVPSLSSSRIESIEVTLPSLKEQITIREALDDADNLIVTLERLIAKKQAIKTGMMQQLLTGKTRLPGFLETWKEVSVSSLGRVVGGGTPSTRMPAYWGGGIPWFTPAEIKADGSGPLSRSERTITYEGLANSAASLLPAGSVLVTSRASIGNCAIAADLVSTNQGFTSLVPKDNRSTWFYYYWVQQNRAAFESRAAGSTFLEISASKVSTIPISVPGLEEQEAIGKVVRDVDTEIEVLLRRAAKVRAIKQGMMQQLLTGRTRLPVEAAV